MGNVPQKDGHPEASVSTVDNSSKGSHRGQSQHTAQQASQAQRSRHHQQQAYNMGVGYGTSMLQHRSPSDASMNSCSNTSPLPYYDQNSQGYLQAPSSNNNSNNGNNNTVGAINLDLLSLDDDAVPTVFRWEHGGRQVYITGTFNGWSRQIPMHRSGNDFTYIHNLKRGKHAFKFIVDDEWRFAPDQATVADIEGRINNFVDVSDFQPYTGDRNFEESLEGATFTIPASSVASGPKSVSTANTSVGGPNRHGSSFDSGLQVPTATTTATPDPIDDEGFGNTMPDIDEYTKEPPPLPPHLRHIILNKPPQLNDTAALPVPQHVALNHLYCTAIKDNMMVLGVTQRYKTKFVTTVYYSPCAS